jgi:hypothetical protein
MRWFRKHRHALFLLGVFHFIFFFPSIFMGRVVSPNDILHGLDPWASVAPMEPQNPTLNDIATSYTGLLRMLRERPSSFHWNRSVGSGIPGFGSAGAAVLSPLVAIPALLLPLSLVYTGILLVKINLSFAFGYLWLREEGMKKRGAAAGALVITAAGTVAVWWLWPSGNAIVLYPALLWIAARLAHGRRVSFTLAAAVALAFALSGYPPAVLYGGYLALFYFTIAGLKRMRQMRWDRVLVALGGIVAAALLASPMLASFFGLLGRTGYLVTRSAASGVLFYPLDHLAAFIQPFRLGDPVGHMWIGDARLGGANNFVESTIYVGVAALIAAGIGVLNRRARMRWFWMAAGLLILTAMFGFRPSAALIERLPGLQFAPLTRLRYLLPIPVGYLVASALSMRWPRVGTRSAVPLAAGMIIVAELALFAARFYPYLRLDEARVRSTPTIDFLAAQQPPFRVLPFFYFLLPNSAEIYGIEDIRSHFSSEERYRRILQRLDPQAFGEFGTILIFNSLRTDIDHPFMRLLGVRYLVEQPTIDILRWSIDEGSVDVPASGSFPLPSPEFRAVAFDVAARTSGPGARLTAALVRSSDGRVVDERTLTPEELSSARVYLRIPSGGASGERFSVQLRPEGMAIDPPRTLRLTRAPLILLRELPDGRIFENVRALPRYWAVWETRELDFESLLADTRFAPEREAVFENGIPDDVARLSSVDPPSRSVRIRLMEYGGAADVIRSSSAVPFLLASSEKATPELRVEVDGRRAEHLLVNGLFAAVLVPAGDHEVRFGRRIGRGLWPASAAGLLLVLGGVMLDLRHRRGRATMMNW